jgi:sec-independent protein translocase protein TatA
VPFVTTRHTLSNTNSVNVIKSIHNKQQQPSLSRGTTNPFRHTHNNKVLQRQRRSVANIQTMGLFGLGAAEIAVILLVVVFVLGPDQIGRMAGKMAGQIKGEYDGLPDELKKIPEEFQKGLEESTENARARNAKKMDPVPKDNDEDDTKK